MNKTNKPVKQTKVTVGLIFSWIFGILFLLTGIGTLVGDGSSIFSGIIIILLSLLIIPISNSFIEEKTNISISGGVKFLIVIVLLMIVGISSSMTSTTQNNQLQETTSSSLEKNTNLDSSSERTYSMNQNIPVDYLTYKVISVESFTEMTNLVSEETAEGKFVRVVIEITNSDSTPRSIFTPRLALVDSNGNIYSSSSKGLFFLKDNFGLAETLQPGVKVTRSELFEVPVASNDFNLQISGDWLSRTVLSVELSNIQNIGTYYSVSDEYKNVQITSLEADCGSAQNWDADAKNDGIVLQIQPKDKSGKVVPAEGTIYLTFYRRAAKDAYGFEYVKGKEIGSMTLGKLSGNERYESFNSYFGYTVNLDWDKVPSYDSSDNKAILAVIFEDNNKNRYEAETGVGYSTCQIKE